MPDPLMTFLLTSEASDLILFAATPFVAWFALSYGFGSPWYKHPLGVITLLMSLSTCGLLLLIDYAMITGGRIEELWRTLVATMFLFASVGKVVILHVERRRGRIERRRRRHASDPERSDAPYQGEEVNHAD